VMQSAIILLSLVAVSAAFECWTCNSNRGDDDSKPCHQVRETCEEGVDSCSMVVYNSPRDGKIHTRKFCTSSGTPIYQYLLFFPGSALCQNINTMGALSRSPRDEVSRAKRAAPPAPPPSTASSSLLCVCTSPLCNDGTHHDVLERTMLANLNLPTTVTSEEDVHRAGPAPPHLKPIGGPKHNALKPTKAGKTGERLHTSQPF
ncbi:hypothetical protein PMAYCL1PPCAC_29811, partial [Pristionchus mayeri]